MLNKYLLISIIFGMTFFYGCGESKLEKEKRIISKGIIKNYPQTTIGRAFEAAFDNPKWTWHEKNGKTYVRFTGKISKKLHDYAMLNFKQNDFDNIDLFYGLGKQAYEKHFKKKEQINLEYQTKYNKIVDNLLAKNLIIIKKIQNYEKQFKTVLRKQYEKIKAKIDRKYKFKKGRKFDIFVREDRKKAYKKKLDAMPLFSSLTCSDTWFMKDKTLPACNFEYLFSETEGDKWKIEFDDDYAVFEIVNSNKPKVIEGINKNPELKKIKAEIIQCLANAKWIYLIAHELKSRANYFDSLASLEYLETQNETFYKKNNNEILYKEIKYSLDNLKSFVKERNTAISASYNAWSESLSKISEKYKGEFWKLNSDVTFEFLLYADQKTFEVVKIHNDSWYKAKLLPITILNVIYSL
jgi:hypothetical protein